MDSGYLQRLEDFVLKTYFHVVLGSKKCRYEEQTAMYEWVDCVYDISYT